MSAEQEIISNLSYQIRQINLGKDLGGLISPEAIRWASRWGLQEEAQKHALEITTEGNPANLTHREAFVWGLQVAFCQTRDIFEAEGRVIEAVLAGEVAHSFYDDMSHLLFGSAVHKISNCVTSVAQKHK